MGKSKKKPMFFISVTVAIIIAVSIAISLFSMGFAANRNDYKAFGPNEGTITTNNVNFRQGPGTSFEKVDSFKKGKKVIAYASVNGWYCVTDEETGKVGAVYSKYVKVDWGSDVAGADSAPGATAAPTANPPTAAPESVQGGGATAAPKETQNVSITTEEQKMLDLINQERDKNGLNPLSFDTNLQKVARLKAKDMVANNYFGHQSPEYGSPFDMMRQFDINFKTAGENIAGNASIEKAIEAWMNSDGHKKNILNAGFNFTGVGIEKSTKYGYVFVEMFIGK